MTEEKDNLTLNENYKAINWNAINDPVDLMTFDTLVSQFWTSTRIPVSNDVSSWNSLDDETRSVVNKVFAELTTLDTLQSREGADMLYRHATTDQHIDVLNNIRFMESIK